MKVVPEPLIGTCLRRMLWAGSLMCLACWVVSYAALIDMHDDFISLLGEDYCIPLIQAGTTARLLLDRGAIVYEYRRTISNPALGPTSYDQGLRVGSLTIAAFLAAYPAYAHFGLWHRSRRRRREGFCAACGYPVRELPTSICPECGTDRKPMDRTPCGDQRAWSYRTWIARVLCGAAFLGVVGGTSACYLVRDPGGRLGFPMLFLLVSWCVWGFWLSRQARAGRRDGAAVSTRPDEIEHGLRRGATLGLMCASLGIIACYAGAHLLRWRLATAETGTDGLFVPYAGNLSLKRAQVNSGLGQLEPDSIYVMLDRTLRARLDVAEGAGSRIKAAAFTDGVGRWWVDADLVHGTYNVTVYPRSDPNLNADPVATFKDSDGDGVVDTKIDWATHTTYTLASPPIWIPREGRTGTPSPVEQRTGSEAEEQYG